MTNLDFLKGVAALNLQIDLLNCYGNLFRIRDIKKSLPEDDEGATAYGDNLFEPEAWKREDEEYARQCADEKWRSIHP